MRRNHHHHNNNSSSSSSSGSSGSNNNNNTTTTTPPISNTNVKLNQKQNRNKKLQQNSAATHTHKGQRLHTAVAAHAVCNSAHAVGADHHIEAL